MGKVSNAMDDCGTILSFANPFRFEEENADPDEVRQVFGSAIEVLGDEFMDEKIFGAYARYEAKLKE